MDFRRDFVDASLPAFRVYVLVSDLEALLVRGRLAPAAAAKLRGAGICSSPPVWAGWPCAFGRLLRSSMFPFRMRSMCAQRGPARVHRAADCEVESPPVRAARRSLNAALRRSTPMPVASATVVMWCMTVGGFPIAHSCPLGLHPLRQRLLSMSTRRAFLEWRWRLSPLPARRCISGDNQGDNAAVERGLV